MLWYTTARRTSPGFSLQIDGNLPMKKQTLFFNQGNAMYRLDRSPIQACTNTFSFEKEHLALCTKQTQHDKIRFLRA